MQLYYSTNNEHNNRHNNHLILLLTNTVMKAQTFVFHNVLSQDAILFCRFVPWYLQVVRTFLDDFQISHHTWSCLQQTHIFKLEVNDKLVQECFYLGTHADTTTDRQPENIMPLVPIIGWPAHGILGHVPHCHLRPLINWQNCVQHIWHRTTLYSIMYLHLNIHTEAKLDVC